MPRSRRFVVALCVVFCSFVLPFWSFAQPATAGSTFRVFLTTGEALPTFGDSAQVGERLVFNLLVGSADGTSLLQLMSVPIASVDLVRTRRYSESVRASNYAATRGESDYAAITADVSRSLDALSQVTDPRRRLQLAEEARGRLLAWSRAHFNYRASDVRELAGLFDEVVAELRAAAGEPRFSLDLRADAAAPDREPLLPGATLAESVAAALAASSVTDVAEDRIAVLRTAVAAVAAERGPAALSSAVMARLGEELRVESAYSSLREDLLARADASLRRGDVKAIEGLLSERAGRDRALGGLRPFHVTELGRQLLAELDRARAFRVGLDHFAYIRPRLLAYQRRIASSLVALDRLIPVLAQIRDMHGVSIETLTTALSRLDRLAADFKSVSPPAYLADVHATIAGALHMAREACHRRRTAVVTNTVAVAREASSAAAGAILLIDQSRTTLRVLLEPPTPK
jgi:hypothetical protein